MIQNMKEIEVDQDIVRCSGGYEGMGHFPVYIRVNTKIPGQAQVCKYCGLKFKKRVHEHH